MYIVSRYWKGRKVRSKQFQRNTSAAHISTEYGGNGSSALLAGADEHIGSYPCRDEVKDEMGEFMLANQTEKHEQALSAESSFYYSHLAPFYVNVSPNENFISDTDKDANNGSSDINTGGVFNSAPEVTKIHAGAVSRKEKIRIEKLRRILTDSLADESQLKDALWSGVPDVADSCLRMFAWQVMLGYVPINKERRIAVLKKKRAEYNTLIEMYCVSNNLSEDQLQHISQIRADLPRAPWECNLLANENVRRAMELALFLFSVRHPATGYVQGMNELFTPFLVAFLAAYQSESCEKVLQSNEVEEETLKVVTADAYWCFAKVLSGIQEHFTFGQPGIQKGIQKLQEIVRRVDEPLYLHLKNHGVDFIQFAFQWMNCFLTREVPFACTLRLWDTYIAEKGDGFPSFHIYVCAVFLGYWTNYLRKMDFQQMMLFMKSFPTSDWTAQDIDAIVAQAYVLKSLFDSSPKHLQ